MIFVNEYEALNNRSYNHDFFGLVGLSYPFRLLPTLTTVIQANAFFGSDILPPLLKVAMN